jgi:hypothetical protein
MAFTKTGIGFAPIKTVDMMPEIGEERDGQVWDGEKWVSKTEWETKRMKPRSQDQ